jgi:hypothetical protein
MPVDQLSAAELSSEREILIDSLLAAGIHDLISWYEYGDLIEADNARLGTDHPAYKPKPEKSLTDCSAEDLHRYAEMEDRLASLTLVLHEQEITEAPEHPYGDWEKDARDSEQTAEFLRSIASDLVT